MEITIKPYSTEYAKQCADIERYLWKENKEGREIRFDWTYTHCPNYSKPLCVIAINENNEVIGFRGYFLNKFFFANKEIIIAQLSDSVVSNKARRMGIFQQMTIFSLNYLTENNVTMILNLSPSWSPYHGYKKMGFEDLAQFHSRYRFNFCQIFAKVLLKRKREHWSNKETFKIEKNGITYCVLQKIGDDILEQVESLENTVKIHASHEINNLRWRTQRPDRHYIYAYAIDNNKKILAFVMFKTLDYFLYDIGFMLYNNSKILKKLFKTFCHNYRPAAIAAWDFALDEKNHKMLRMLGMHSIPFINKIRKNPPVLVRTLQTNQDGDLNWIVNGIDIRKVENWSISKLDLDSF